MVVAGDFNSMDVVAEYDDERDTRMIGNGTTDGYHMLAPLQEAGFVDCGPNFHTVKTFPASAPRYRLDFIFLRAVDRRVECRNARTFGRTEPLPSDHLGVTAELLIRA